MFLELTVQVVGDRRDPRDVDVVGDDLADPFDGGRGLEIGRTVVGKGAEHDGAAVGGGLGLAHGDDARDRRDVVGQRADTSAPSAPGASRSMTTRSGPLNADAEALGEEVVGLSVRGRAAGASPAAGKAVWIRQARAQRVASRATDGAQQVGPGATGHAVTEAPPGAVLGARRRGGAAASLGRCRSGHRAG